MSVNIKLKNRNGTSQTFSGVNSIVLPKDGGGTQEFVLDDALPQLNTPSISISQNTLSISNPATNGNFATEFAVLAGGTEVGTTSTATYDLASNVTGDTATITVKARGTKFRDSEESTSATYERYYTVTMYDDDETTLIGTEQVKHGQMPTAPSKAGFEFVEWVDGNGSPVTSIDEDISIYAVWTDTIIISAGTYQLNETSPLDNFVVEFYTPSSFQVIYDGGTPKSANHFLAKLDTGMGMPPYPEIIYKAGTVNQGMLLTRLESTTATTIKWTTHPTYGADLMKYVIAVSGDWELSLTYGHWFNDIFHKVT